MNRFAFPNNGNLLTHIKLSFFTLEHILIISGGIASDLTML